MHFLHRALFVLCLLLLSQIATSCNRSDSKTHWQLEVFDPVSRQTRTITETDLAHKFLVINYWAEWCKPCLAEIPELNRFAQSDQQGIVMVGINFDNKQGSSLEEAVRKVGITFPVAITKPYNLVLPEISGLPTTLILDDHGILKQQLPGPQTTESLQKVLHGFQ